MKKTSIYVEPNVDLALARRAAEEGTTKAALIHRALRAAARGFLGVEPRAAGVFEGPVDFSARIDEHLSASGFGES